MTRTAVWPILILFVLSLPTRTLLLVLVIGADNLYKVACAIGGGVVWRGAAPFRLGRLLVRDWDGDVFAPKLREYLTL